MVVSDHGSACGNKVSSICFSSGASEIHGVDLVPFEGVEDARSRFRKCFFARWKFPFFTSDWPSWSRRSAIPELPQTVRGVWPGCSL